MPRTPAPTATLLHATVRPRVGLVLAGGGAKGGAHVGVLKVLEELHVPIDCIAGTSMGALVGAGYASGIPAAELENFVTGIDWKAVVGGVGRRDLEPIEQKRAGATYSNDFEFGLQDKRVVRAGGHRQHQRHRGPAAQLRGRRAARSQISTSLPIPYRAVATDMVSGEMVVLKEGDLATAMRASMAIPGAFAPVMTDEYILVRRRPGPEYPGGRGARPLCGRGHRRQPGGGGSQARETAVCDATAEPHTDVMIVANENLQLDSLTERDIRIDVIMGDITHGRLRACARNRSARRSGSPRDGCQSGATRGAWPSTRVARRA